MVAPVMGAGENSSQASPVLQQRRSASSSPALASETGDKHRRVVADAVPEHMAAAEEEQARCWLLLRLRQPPPAASHAEPSEEAAAATAWSRGVRGLAAVAPGLGCCGRALRCCGASHDCSLEDAGAACRGERGDWNPPAASAEMLRRRVAHPEPRGVRRGGECWFNAAAEGPPLRPKRSVAQLLLLCRLADRRPSCSALAWEPQGVEFPQGSRPVQKPLLFSQLLWHCSSPPSCDAEAGPGGVSGGGGAVVAEDVSLKGTSPVASTSLGLCSGRWRASLGRPVCPVAPSAAENGEDVGSCDAHATVAGICVLQLLLLLPPPPKARLSRALATRMLRKGSTRRRSGGAGEWGRAPPALARP